MILETERLYLREMNQADFHSLREILQDEDTMYAYEGAFSDNETQEWLDKQISRYQKWNFGLWAVILKETDGMIGQCGLMVQPWKEKLERNRNMKRFFKIWLKMTLFMILGPIFVGILVMTAFTVSVKAAALVAILFLLGLEVMMAYMYKDDIAKKRRCSEKVKGVITAVSKSKRVVDLTRGREVRDNEYDYHVTVQYNVGGNTYTAQTTFLGYASVGDKETVHYNPSEPSDSHIGPDLAVTGIGLRIGVVAFTLIILCIVVFILL